jgi:hypothetical protein
VAHPTLFTALAQTVSFKLITRRPLGAIDVRASTVCEFAALVRRHELFTQFAPVDVTRRERLGRRPNRAHGDERSIVVVVARRRFAATSSMAHRRWGK